MCRMCRDDGLFLELKHWRAQFSVSERQSGTEKRVQPFLNSVKRHLLIGGLRHRAELTAAILCTISSHSSDHVSS